MVDQAQREGVGGMHPSYIPEYPGSKFLIERWNTAARVLFEWLLPLRTIRAPSRFSLIGLLGIAVLSAVAIQWFLQRTTAVGVELQWP